MAKAKGKKPADIIDVIHDIVSPWLGTPPGQHTSITQGQQLARGAAETLDQVYAGGMIKAGTQGNKALAKQAAINAAALGTGYIAGKVIQTATGAVAKSGIVPRVVNRIVERDNVYFMHGSPRLNLETIRPAFPPDATPIPGTKYADFEGVEVEKELYGTIISHKGLTNNKLKSTWSIPESKLRQDLDRTYGYTVSKSNARIGPQGSIYIAKTPRSTVEDFGSEMITTSPASVVREFRVKNKTVDDVYGDVSGYLKKIGVRIQPPKRR